MTTVWASDLSRGYRIGGQYAFITKGVPDVAGVNINDEAYSALQKAIDPQRLLLTLPAEVVKYNPVIDDAELVVNGGYLLAQIRMSALVNSEHD